MIYTVTFNPSLDYVVRVGEFTLGNLHRTEEEELFVGGKGINVSTVLNQLEVKSVALGFIAGFTGNEIIHQLNASGISSDFILLDQGMSRINVKLKSEGHVETEINAQGPSINRSKLEKLYHKLEQLAEGDFLILSGSVPKNLPDADYIYADICKLLTSKKIRIIVDAEGDLLRNTLSYRPFLVKPNQEELEKLFGQTLRDDESILRCARMIQEQGAQNVLVSMAGEGAFLLDEFGHTYRRKAPKGKVLNSVGAGDSMLAGFLAGLLHSIEGHPDCKEIQEKDYSEALSWGIAAGSAGAFSIGLPEADTIHQVRQQMNLDSDFY